jgi:CTP-dependent riboflavin kinase
MKETLLAKLVEKKLITKSTKIEADYIEITAEGTQLPKKRSLFNVLNVTSSPMHPSLVLSVVNTTDNTPATLFSYEILTIDGQKPQRFAVANGVPADGIERTTKRRGRKPKIRDNQDDVLNEIDEDFDEDIEEEDFQE